MIIIREDWATLVRLVALSYDRPMPTDDEIEYVLWERTCFPFGTVEMVLPQVRDIFASPAPSDG